MDELPRQKLGELLATYGRSLCDDPRRCEGLLRDMCGAHKREVNVLVSALKEHIATDLLSSSVSNQPREVLLARLTKRLTENLGLAEDAARWAVDSWALALGIITLQDLRKLRKETGKGRGTKTTKNEARTTKETDGDSVSTRNRKEESPKLKERQVELTSSQQEVLAFLAQGYSDEQITQALSIPKASVSGYISVLQQQTGVITRKDLMVWAITHGFGQTPPSPPIPPPVNREPPKPPPDDPVLVQLKHSWHKEDSGPPPVLTPGDKHGFGTDDQGADGGSTFWSGLLAVLSIPFILAGLMVFLFGSAIIAMLPILLVLWALGLDWDQLGDTTQGVLGLLVLGLTVGVMGLLATGWEVLKRKFGYGVSQTS